MLGLTITLALILALIIGFLAGAVSMVLADRSESQDQA